MDGPSGMLEKWNNGKLDWWNDGVMDCPSSSESDFDETGRGGERIPETRHKTVPIKCIEISL